MNVKILFIAIYRALECLEEETKCEAISAFLDKANPYIFKDRKSADPIIFNEFVKWIEDNNLEVRLETSYALAQRYITENTPFAAFFEDIDEEEWTSLIDIIKNEEPQLVEKDYE